MMLELVALQHLLTKEQKLDWTNFLGFRIKDGKLYQVLCSASEMGRPAGEPYLSDIPPEYLIRAGISYAS